MVSGNPTLSVNAFWARRAACESTATTARSRRPQLIASENPRGYCPDHSTGVSCPVGLGVSVGHESEAPIKFG